MPARQIVLFPFAGGSAQSFARLMSWLPAFEPVPVDYPGHHNRAAEPLLRTVPDLAHEGWGRIGDELRSGYVALGVSMGALVAFEFARIAQRAERRPDALVVLSAIAPGRIPSRERIADLPDHEFAAALLARYPGELTAAATDPEVREFVLPVLRADIAAFEDCGTRPATAVDIPVLAIGGLRDRAVRYADLLAWSGLSTRRVDVIQVDGGHFLVADAADRVAGEILTWLDLSVTGGAEHTGPLPRHKGVPE